MKPEIYEGLWLECEGDGTDYVPADFVSLPPWFKPGDSLSNEFDAQTTQRHKVEVLKILSDVAKYVENHKALRSITLRQGFGARFSAPGYLDCTRWSFYETESEAREALFQEWWQDAEDIDIAEQSPTASFTLDKGFQYLLERFDGPYTFDDIPIVNVGAESGRSWLVQDVDQVDAFWIVEAKTADGAIEAFLASDNHPDHLAIDSAQYAEYGIREGAFKDEFILGDDVRFVDDVFYDVSGLSVYGRLKQRVPFPCTYHFADFGDVRPETL